MNIAALNEFTGIIRRAVDDYGMIEEGDRIAVGVSGGKDSLLLLLALKHLQSYYPKHFELEAITLELELLMQVSREMVTRTMKVATLIRVATTNLEKHSLRLNCLQ